jgi:hypothetical protein
VPKATLDTCMTAIAGLNKAVFLVPILLHGAPELIIEKRNMVATLKYKNVSSIPGINST